MQSLIVQRGNNPLPALHPTLAMVALLAAVLTVLSTRAHADWVDEMPDVGDVAAVITHEYDHGPNDQSTTAVNLAAALILLRQLIEYRIAEGPALSLEQRARLQAASQSYLLAEFAIGRNPGARRGALSEAEARHFYESRRYEKCVTADCYRYWIGQQLEFWGAAKFRERILPLLFPCGDAPDLLTLAGRHAMSAPLVPSTPALPSANDPTQSQLAVTSPPAAPCDPTGTDIDGDGLCFAWESTLKGRAAADGDAACRITLADVHMQDPTTLRVTVENGARYAGTEVRFRVARGTEPDMAAALEQIPSRPATIVRANAGDLQSAYALVTLDAPVSTAPLPADPQTPLPFVYIDAASLQSRGPVHCEQPMPRWLPRHKTPPMRGLHGPYATLNETLIHDLAPLIAYRNTGTTEAGFIIVRDARLANGGYYSTPPRFSSSTSVSPTFLVQDYDASFHRAFDGSCESITDFIIAMPVHTHPLPSPNIAALAVDNFTMVDFNMAIRLFLAGINQGRYEGVNFHWGADGGHPTRLEGIALVNARNACVMRFTALAGDDDFPDALATAQQTVPWLSSDDYKTYTGRTNTFIPIASPHPSGTLGHYDGTRFVAAPCDGQ